MQGDGHAFGGPERPRGRPGKPRRAATGRTASGPRISRGAARPGATTRRTTTGAPGWRAVRDAALDLRYGEEARAFARERGEIMEAWGYLCTRARREGAAFAAEPVFAATLARHAAALKTAARMRAKPAATHRC